jgi:Zn finger protein HypA/HybF involved in hydrogenase expression
MHELSVATGIVDLALSHTGGRRLTAVNLAVGLNAGVFKDSLLFYLDLLFEEKGIKDVKVGWRDVPMHCRCDCGAEYETTVFLAPCPTCGSFTRSMTGGQDCTVDSIEVDDG